MPTTSLLLERGDINQDGFTNGADVAALHAAFGTSGWLEDLNVDGTVDINDVQTLITELVGTVNADFNLDGIVNGTDLLAWQVGAGSAGGDLFSQGDANLDGTADGADLALWSSLYGTVSLGSSYGATASLVPEPGTCGMVGSVLMCVACASKRRRKNNVTRRMC